MSAGIIDEEQLGGLAEAAGVDAVRMILEAYWESTEALTSQLQDAVAANDTDETAKAGHALKGSSANLGATLLANRAKEIEAAARSGDMARARSLLTGFAEDISSTRSAMDTILVRFA